jgi:hypothetical protein
VERLLAGKGVPVIALLAEAHLETLHRLAQLPAGTRVGVVASAVETGHSLEHSIATAALPNIVRVETCAAERTALGRLVRRVDAIVCSTSTAARVRGLVGPTVPVILDDRALNQRAIQMLGAILGEHDGDGGPPVPPPPARRGRSPRRIRAAPGHGAPLGRRRRGSLAAA